MRYLLDTNILSEFVRRRPNERVIARARAVPAHDLATSAVCVMELRFGAMRRPDSASFWSRLEREVISRVRVEPLDDDAARRSGDILAALQLSGQVIGVPDAQVGGTAVARGYTLVTANARHFARIAGLQVEDWTAP